jgi:predicted nucleic acid-binding protein
MPDAAPAAICNTSPLQYLHQLRLLDLLPRLYPRILVPTAVVGEIEAGRALGHDLPDVSALAWATVVTPTNAAFLPTVADLGAGEREVLALAVETPVAVAILDDALARQHGKLLRLRLTGTLGLLLRAKREGAVGALRPLIDRLSDLRFRAAPEVRAEVLRLAGEI